MGERRRERLFCRHLKDDAVGDFRVLLDAADDGRVDSADDVDARPGVALLVRLHLVEARRAHDALRAGSWRWR